MKNVIAERAIHSVASRIVQKVPLRQGLISILKEFTESECSSTMNCWLIQNGMDMVHDLLNIFKGLAFSDFSFVKLDLSYRLIIL